VFERDLAMALAHTVVRRGARGFTFEDLARVASRSRLTISFVADWLSGKHRFGYVTPGFSITVSKTSFLYAGYSMGNQGRKNNALFIYYGITF